MKVDNLKFFLLIPIFIPTLLFSQVDTAWVRRYNGSGNGSDVATFLFVANDGNLYVTGYSYQTDTYEDYTTLKYDSDGNLLWERRYDGQENDEDVATFLFVDNDGNVYVTGYSYCYGTSYDYLTLKYDSDGNLLWERRYNGSGNGDDVACAVAVDNLGNVYVTGYSFGSGTSYDYATLKYDSDGNLLWERRYNGSGNGDDVACAVAVDNLGNVYVTGCSSYDYATLKYDSDGNLLWERRYNGSGNSHDEAYALAVDNFGNVYVSGYSTGSGTYLDYLTLKYDTDGNLLWERRYNGPVNSSDVAYALVVDDFGNVYVTGGSEGFGIHDYDYATLKYDTDGNLLWERRYEGQEDDKDVATFLFVDNDGNVYVTGYSYRYGTSYDYLTLKYDRNGNLLWERRYNGSGNGDDVACAVAVDNLGNVYVTGCSIGLNTGYDYLTIKYIQEEPSIGEKKENKPGSKIKKLYDTTGKLVKENKLKKGIYFLKTEKENKKVLILK